MTTLYPNPLHELQELIQKLWRVEEVLDRTVTPDVRQATLGHINTTLPTVAEVRSRLVSLYDQLEARGVDDFVLDHTPVPGVPSLLEPDALERKPRDGWSELVDFARPDAASEASGGYLREYEVVATSRKREMCIYGQVMAPDLAAAAQLLPACAKRLTSVVELGASDATLEPVWREFPWRHVRHRAMALYEQRHG